MKDSFKTFIASSLVITIALFILSNSAFSQGSISSKTKKKTVLQIVNSNKNTSEFAKLLKQSGYSAILKRKGPFTVLAPNNKAIENTDGKLKGKPKQLMKGQIYKGEISKDRLKSQKNIKILETDKTASNGVVYVVDKVTQPKK